MRTTLTGGGLAPPRGVVTNAVTNAGTAFDKLNALFRRIGSAERPQHSTLNKGGFLYTPRLD